MSALATTLACGACLGAGAGGGLALASWLERRARARRREAAYGEARRHAGPEPLGVAGMGLRYAAGLSRRLYAGSAEPWLPRVRAGKASDTRAGRWYRQRARVAGCSKEVSTAAFCEARARLAVCAALAGALAGAIVSTELSIALALAAGYLAGSAPRRAVKAACVQRSAEAERHLSEMLEVVALGLRSGLTFDRGFALYGSHFDNEFARSCAKACRSWSLGLVTREEALRELAASYDCDQLERVVDAIVRSLRFGSPLTDLLEEAAAQSRAGYRSALEERVAKAPVKMMLPTGTLILPAMLLLVMGPILLELAGGFS